MSNMFSQNQKVISIKKVADIRKHKTDFYQHSLSEQKANLTLELDQLKQQLTDLRQQKEKMLTDLKAAIQEEKTEWLELKKKESEEAREVGYKIGYDEGLEKVEKQWEQSLEKANQLVSLANDDYYRTIDKHQDAIIQLAIATSEKIIGDTLVENKKYFMNIIQKAIHELKEYAYIEIYVHPANYEYVIKQKEELEQIVDDRVIISIYADQQLQEGDCTMKHPHGQVDVGIDLQLRQIKNMLAEKIAEQS